MFLQSTVSYYGPIHEELGQNEVELGGEEWEGEDEGGGGGYADGSSL